MGIDQTLAPERTQIGSNKIFSKEPKMPLKMFMISDKGENLCQKWWAYFLAIYGFLVKSYCILIEAFNAYKYFKCFNTYESNWGQLEIILIVPTIIFRSFQNELVFLLIQNTSNK